MLRKKSLNILRAMIIIIQADVCRFIPAVINASFPQQKSILIIIIYKTGSGEE